MSRPNAKKAKSNSGVPINTTKPNILYVVVDQMRYPQVFPAGIENADDYMRVFMPNTYNRIWKQGVKFENHITASAACTPSRGVLATGLYSHQTWAVNTLVPFPPKIPLKTPALNSTFPTYGKILREVGYKTPYCGKWHCSLENANINEEEKKRRRPLKERSVLEFKHEEFDYCDLEEYGFESVMKVRDPIGYNLEGIYGSDFSNTESKVAKFVSDGAIGDAAVQWFHDNKDTTDPWCFTVCFQNPHDQQFFPGGTEFQAFQSLYNEDANNNWAKKQCLNSYPDPNGVVKIDNSDVLLPKINGKSYDYPSIPPNFETVEELKSHNKPLWQLVMRQFNEETFGGISEDPATAVPTNRDVYVPPPVFAEEYPGKNITPFKGYEAPENSIIVKAPYNYWSKALEVYAYFQYVVDKEIGKVLDAMTDEMRENTIIVFTSDHGDYVGAHGLVSGKLGSMYNEIVNVPLAVYDPTNRFTKDTHLLRHQYTSSVDMAPLLVSLGYGSYDWVNIKPVYRAMYGEDQRYNMLKLLQSASDPGPDHVLFAGDEVILYKFDFGVDPATYEDDVEMMNSRTPFHIIGVIDQRTGNRLVQYTNWKNLTCIPSTDKMEWEYYDYSTANGRKELVNTAETQKNEEDLIQLKSWLVTIGTKKLRKEFPAGTEYHSAQRIAKTLVAKYDLAFKFAEVGADFLMRKYHQF